MDPFWQLKKNGKKRINELCIFKCYSKQNSFESTSYIAYRSLLCLFRFTTFFVVEKLNKYPTCEVKSTSQFALGNEMSSFRLKIESDSRKHNRYSIELSEETRKKMKRLFYAFVNNSSKYSGSRFV
jgi:hypothetical protein